MSAKPRDESESVWDYPRPPRLEPVTEPVRVTFEGAEVARTDSAVRILETASPPTVYLPMADVRMDLLSPSSGGSTFCEWKGAAEYFDVASEGVVSARAAWYYPQPSEAFRAIADHVSFYPALVECFIGEERVRPQAGGFYGGWVTDRIRGPFKGEPGTEGW